MAAPASREHEKRNTSPVQQRSRKTPSPQNQTRRQGLRHLSYEEGRQALRPKQGLEVPKSPQEAVHLAQRTVESASISATLEEGQTLHKDRLVEVLFEAGSRLSVSLDPLGLHFTSEPGILLKIRYAPDFRITHIRWDFETARFDCSATPNWFDILGIIGAVGERKIEQVLNTKLRPLLPEAVRRPGYSPSSDKDLPKTIAELSRVFDLPSAQGGKREKGGKTEPKAQAPGQPVPFGKLRDPHASLSARLPEEVHVPLGGNGLELFIEAKTLFFLWADAKGRLEKPLLERLCIEAQGKGIVVRPTSGTFRAFKELHLKGITILRGGKFEFDYELSAEKLGEGLLGLVALLGLASGRDVGPVPRVRLTEVRKEIDARLQKEVPPRFQALLKRYDNLIPGFSLTSIFGT